MNNTTVPTGLLCLEYSIYPPTFTKPVQILGHITILNTLKNIYVCPNQKELNSNLTAKYLWDLPQIFLN